MQIITYLLTFPMYYSLVTGDKSTRHRLLWSTTEEKRRCIQLNQCIPAQRKSREKKLEEKLNLSKQKILTFLPCWRQHCYSESHFPPCLCNSHFCILLANRKEETWRVMYKKNVPFMYKIFETSSEWCALFTIHISILSNLKILIWLTHIFL